MYMNVEFEPVYISRLTGKYPKISVNLSNPTSIFIFSDKETLLKMSVLRFDDEMRLVNITRERRKARLKE